MTTVKMIKTAGRQFVDFKGRPVILKGVNMVCKDRSLGHLAPYTEEDFHFLKNLGVNVVRLGIFWESLEPQPGIYNDAYLQGLDRIIALARMYGICVFLDMHQDLFSSIYEDGAPEWATLSGDAEHVRTELWSESYLLSPAVQKAFDCFWSNMPAADGKGIMDHFVDAWAHVAARYADEPFVIGYDFFNEPFPGSPALQILPAIGGIMEKLNAGTAGESAIFKALSSIEEVTAPFDREVLSSFYDRIVKAVRKYDPESIAFLENDYFGNAAVPVHISPVYEEAASLRADGSSGCGQGSDAVSGSVAVSDSVAVSGSGIQKEHMLKNQAYAPHGYDIFVDTDLYDDPDTSRVDLIFANHFETAKALGLPMLVGEWGCYPNASEVQLAQFRHIKELFASMGASDTYFDYEQVKAQPALAQCLKEA